MELQGLIAAAGQSRRMGRFKPLESINGFPMIAMTVQSLRNGGVREITVVVGKHAGQMRRVLSPLGVRIVENPDYERTDMFHSLCLGLREMTEAEGVCVLPGDVPLLSPGTMKRLREKLLGLSRDTQALQPRLLGRDAHPPVLLPGAYGEILAYGGAGGLGGILSLLKREYVELPDSERDLDADVPEELEALRRLAGATRGAAPGICEALYEEARLPEPVRRHCRAVGELAAHMAERLILTGACLDVELCRSGGMLHDICRREKGHEERGREFLERRGYAALGEIAGRHSFFSRRPESLCREWVLVCLADKLLRGEERVTLRERYRPAFAHEQVKPERRKSYEICCLLAAEYEKQTGDSLGWKSKREEGEEQAKWKK